MAQFDVKVNIFAVEWRSDYAHVRDWETEEQRAEYFRALESQSNFFVIQPLAQIRKSGTLKIPTVISGAPSTENSPSLGDLEKVNYLSFNQDGRDWFYFIDSVEYLGNHQAVLSLTLDVWQTYFFDFKIQPSFVKRKTTEYYYKGTNFKKQYEFADTFENVDVGEVLKYNLVSNLQDENNIGLSFLWIVATEALFGDQTQPGRYGIYTPFYIYVLPFRSDFTAQQVSSLVPGVSTDNPSFTTVLRVYEKIKSNLKVVSLFVTGNIPVPDLRVTNTVGNTYRVESIFLIPVQFDSLKGSIGNSGYIFKPNITDPKAIIKTINLAPFCNADIPKEDVYPFHFFKLTSNRGNDYIIRQHLAQKLNDRNENLTINIQYSLSIGAQAKEGYSVTDIYGNPLMTLVANNSINSLPLISDKYLEYIQTSRASERAGLASNIIGGFTSIIGGAASGNYMGAISGGVDTVLNTYQHYAKIQDLKDTPDSVKKPGNDYIFEISLGSTGVQLWECELPENQKAALKNYFYYWGYSINRVMDINIHEKETFDYIQTVNSVVTGNISDEARIAIQNILNNGVTIWHYGKQMYDYSLYPDNNGDA